MSLRPAPTLPRLLLAATACIACLAAAPAQAGLSAAASTDIVAARSAFLAGAPEREVYDWNTIYGPWFPANFGSQISFTRSDGSVDRVLGNLSLGNWVDGPGFESLDGLQHVSELALNGVESFDLAFGKGYRSVGLAVASGHGNVPNQFDLNGASFEFTALDAAAQVIGSATLVLEAGAPVAKWVTLVASAPMRQLLVREVGAVHINDQYFGNIVVAPGAVAAVPEAPSALLLALGLVGMGGLVQARRRHTNAPGG